MISRGWMGSESCHAANLAHLFVFLLMVHRSSRMAHMFTFGTASQPYVGLAVKGAPHKTQLIRPPKQILLHAELVAR